MSGFLVEPMTSRVRIAPLRVRTNYRWENVFCVQTDKGAVEGAGKNEYIRSPIEIGDAFSRSGGIVYS